MILSHLRKLLLAAVCISAFWLHAADRPNILFILVDDQAPWDIKAYNTKSPLNTLNIDTLASRGMTIDRAYQMGGWVGAVCTCSRRMIISGRTLWHIPSRDSRDDQNPLSADPAMVPPGLADNTLAAVFNRAGYATMRTCKADNCYPEANTRFSVDHEATCREGNDDHGNAWHARQVLEHLDQRDQAHDHRPFLIYLGFSHPHDIRDGKPDLLKKYGAVNFTDRNATPPANPDQPPLPVNWLPHHPFDTTHSDVRDETGVSGVWRHRDPSSIRNEIGREFACAENIDLQISKVLARLKAMGELDNTYIFYTSDHGISVGRHGLMGKQNFYDETWRVPFIAVGPGIRPGSRAIGNIYPADMLPTLCELTGITPSSTVETTSFKPVLTGLESRVRDVLYGAYAGGRKPSIRAVQKGDWKLIKYESNRPGSLHTQLSNLAENPYELLPAHQDPCVIALTGHTPSKQETDLADDPRFAAQRHELETLLWQQMKACDAPYHFSDQPRSPGPLTMRSIQNAARDTARDQRHRHGLQENHPPRPC